MTDFSAGTSPRRLARIAGALYLINIVFGAFSIGVVPAILIVPDMAATAHNIQAHELLYRLGLVAHIVVTATNVPMAVIFYDLLKVVNRRIALLDVFFTLVATSVEVASLPGQFTPLLLLGSRLWWGPPACPASSPHCSCWAAAATPAPCRQHNCTRWHTCPATCRTSTTASTRCSTPSTSCASPTSCTGPRSCPRPSASCWRPTPWPTWSTPSRPCSHQGPPPIWFPGSGCPRLLAKDRSACGSCSPA